MAWMIKSIFCWEIKNKIVKFNVKKKSINDSSQHLKLGLDSRPRVTIGLDSWPHRNLGFDFHSHSHLNLGLDFCPFL